MDKNGSQTLLGCSRCVVPTETGVCGPHSPYFWVVKEWLYPLADPPMVEATIHVSYLVLPDRDLRVYEVVLAGTVTSAEKHPK